LPSDDTKEAIKAVEKRNSTALIVVQQEAGENVGKYTNLFYVNLGLSEPLSFYPKVSHALEERLGG
jgi:hypothetical protein